MAGGREKICTLHENFMIRYSTKHIKSNLVSREYICRMF